MRPPEFPADAVWLNTNEPLSFQKLKGHLVILDFWTYCCINCLHVLVELKALEKKYADKPVIVVGVHAAKFTNEGEVNQIQKAIERYQIEHPVVVDTEFHIWKSYAIRAWPSFVVVGPDGKITQVASGEGIYEPFDQLISKALKDPKFKKHWVSDQQKVSNLKSTSSYQKEKLQFPAKFTLDAQKNQVWIANTNCHQVLGYQLNQDLSHGELIAKVGSGNEGYQDGSFKQACFAFPQGLCFGEEQELFIADTQNHVIRKLDLTNQTVKTLVGDGKKARMPFHQMTNHQSLSSPWDLCLINQKLFIALAGTHQLAIYDLQQQKITQIVGNGYEGILDGSWPNAHLAQPSGIVCDVDNNRVYFVDSETSAIRFLDLATQQVQTLIGQGLFDFGHRDGFFDDALLQHAIGLAIHQNLLFVADTFNHAIRVLDLNTNQIKTFYHQKDGPYALDEPHDVIWHPSKVLLLLDTNNHRLLKLSLETSKVSQVLLLKTGFAFIGLILDNHFHE